MAQEVAQDTVRVVRAAEVSDHTAQTAGMGRRVGISADTAGASRIWMGHAVGPPGMDTGPHHHGEAETAGYIVRGTARILWGERFEQYVDVGPGDFIFVPAYLPHIERNVSDEPCEFIIARTPDNIVINLPPLDEK
jgi:uncharacterized RmlC-like cupin family protein